MKKGLLIIIILIGLSGVNGLHANTSNKVYVSSEAEFNSLIKNNPVVFVLVSATWCPHCKQVKPIVDGLAQTNKNVLFAYLDADTRSIQGLVDRLAPEGYPVIKVYKNGRMVKQLLGSQAKSTLQNLIS